MSVDNLRTCLMDMNLSSTETEHDAINTPSPQTTPSTEQNHLIRRPQMDSQPADMHEPTPDLNAVQEIWAKQGDMRNKYYQTLWQLLPLIRQLQERQPSEKRELFMAHIDDVFRILNMPRSMPLPERLTVTVLQRAERFIIQVIAVHQRYVEIKGMQY